MKKLDGKSWIIILCSLALVVNYYSAFVWMYHRFIESDSSYSHGFLIPFITAYLIFVRGAELRKLPQSSSFAGFILMMAGLLMNIVGWGIFKVGFAAGLSLIIVMLGGALYLYGIQIAKAVAFPLIFLVFMVPLPKVALLAITFKMKMMAAAAATAIASSLHIAIHRSGSMLYIPNGVLTVGNECSGINSLISLVTLSVLFAYMTVHSPLKRSVFVVVAFPIALIANICRITFLILAAYIYGTEAAMNGILHYGAGMMLWIVALILLGLTWKALQWEKLA